MENKYLWAIAGLLLGYFIAKRRTEKKAIATAQAMADEAVEKSTALFDEMLAAAQSKNATVADVRAALKAA